MNGRIHWPTGDALAKAWELPLVERHDTIASTQDRALALARGGAAPWSAVVASSQTRGRGRRGRAWDSAPGLGLWLSLVMPSVDDVSTDSLPLTLRLGVGLADTVEQALPGTTVQVKWPNDIWLHRRKVAGVLAERVGPHTVVGIGVNVFHDSNDFEGTIRAGATSLWLEGWRGEAVPLGADVIAGLRDAVAQSPYNALSALRQRDALFDREFTCPDGRIGRGAGIDGSGALLVHDGDEKWRVTSGTIHLGPAQEVSQAGG